MQVRRVTGLPADRGPATASRRTIGARAPCADLRCRTPGLARLAAVVDRARRAAAGATCASGSRRSACALIVFGFVCILLGWYGAAHSPYLYQEMPYLISGGLLGVALVIGGGILVRSAWSMRQVEEDRRNALAIVRSVDRLERILRSLDETRRADTEEHVR